jgi:hypothetical protein
VHSLYQLAQAVDIFIIRYRYLIGLDAPNGVRDPASPRDDQAHSTRCLSFMVFANPRTGATIKLTKVGAHSSYDHTIL